MDNCPLCESPLSLVSERRSVRVGAREAEIVDEFLRCDSCGEELYGPGQMDRALSMASEQIRKADGLLQPHEIRSIRQGLGATQAQLEKLIGAGAKTVVRWEKGTVFQNRTADTLLRVIRDVPEAAEYLAAKNGVLISTSIPSWPEGFREIQILGSGGTPIRPELFGPRSPVSTRIRVGNA